MSAHLAFGAPKIMTSAKNHAATAMPAAKASQQGYGLTETQARRMYNSLPPNLKQMVSELKEHLSSQFRAFGLHEEAVNTTNLEMVRMLYEMQNDPAMAQLVGNPSGLKSVMDVVIQALEGKLRGSNDEREREAIRAQLSNTRVLSNFFGKVAEYAQSQYLDLLDRIKRSGDAEMSR